MEGVADSRLFSSGMAAIAAILRTDKPDGTILLQSGIYWGTTLFFRKTCARTDIKLIGINGSDQAALKTTITDTARDLVFLEVPSNPFLRIADFGAVAKLADNTLR